jgi:nicotinamidase-related amidase
MKNYIFIDIFTQKGFVENFGSAAIEDCPNIRENLMDITSVAIRNKIPMISLMWTGFSEADFEKVADTEAEDSGFGSEFLQQLIRVEQQDLSDFNMDFSDKVLFVYGVLLDISVVEFCKKFVGKCAKLWIVEDAVKSTDGHEEEVLMELKKFGCKRISTRNLEKFVSM